MVPAGNFEIPTPRLQSEYSASELHRQLSLQEQIIYRSTNWASPATFTTEIGLLLTYLGNKVPIIIMEVSSYS